MRSKILPRPASKLGPFAYKIGRSFATSDFPSFLITHPLDSTCQQALGQAFRLPFAPFVAVTRFSGAKRETVGTIRAGYANFKVVQTVSEVPDKFEEMRI